MSTTKVLGSLSTAATVMFGAVPGSAEAATKEDGVRAAIMAFADGGDRRDLASLESVLSPSFRVVLSSPQAGGAVKTLSRDEYLGLIKAGKAGGKKRALDIRKLEVSDSFAWASVRLEHEEAVFDASVTLAKEGAFWLVVQDAVVFTPKSR